MHHVKQGVAIYTLHLKVPFIILFFGSLDGIMGTRISHIVTILLFEHVIFHAGEGLLLEGVPTAPTTYRVYPERWWILVSVLVLDVANNAHWVAFPSVSQR